MPAEDAGHNAIMKIFLSMQSTMATLATKVHVEEMLQPLEKKVHDFGTKVDGIETKH